MFGVSPSGYRAAHNSVPKSASGTHLDDVSRYRPPDYGEPLPVEVKDLPSMKLVFLRHAGPYSEVGATWGRLMTWVGTRGLLGPGMRMIGIVYDPDITPADKTRYDAAVMVNRAVQLEGEFGVMEIPGGKYAVGGWLPKSGRELRDAEELLTRIHVPVGD